MQNTKEKKKTINIEFYTQWKKSLKNKGKYHYYYTYKS